MIIRTDSCSLDMLNLPWLLKQFLLAKRTLPEKGTLVRKGMCSPVSVLYFFDMPKSIK